MTDNECSKYIGQTVKWWGDFEVKCEILNVDCLGFILKILDIDSCSNAAKYYKIGDIIHVGPDATLKFV